MIAITRDVAKINGRLQHWRDAYLLDRSEPVRRRLFRWDQAHAVVTNQRHPRTVAFFGEPGLYLPGLRNPADE